jgi:methylmalonyl-CoA mutase C-terminal domain/subunit
MATKQIKVLLGKVGLDGHDRGVRLLSVWLRDVGMEVIYLGTHNTPQTMVQAALEEDVDVIGLSFQGADHLFMIKEVTGEIAKAGLEEVLLLVGGSIPRRDIGPLKEMGVDEVFLPGTMMQTIVDFIEQHAG